MYYMHLATLTSANTHPKQPITACQAVKRETLPRVPGANIFNSAQPTNFSEP